MCNRLLYARLPRWAAILERAEALMAEKGFQAVKDEARTRAGLLSDGEDTVFIKRFNVGSWALGLIERIRGSRAARSLKGAALLEQAGFACPQPLAALEVRSAGSVRASYLLSQALVQARTLSRFIDRRQSERSADLRWRRAVSRALANEIRRLHDAGLHSSDLQETNLMLEEGGDGLCVHFVDLDGFRRYPRVSWRLRACSLVQLDRSVGRFLSRTERLRFLYDYLGQRPERAAMCRIVSDLRRRRARKERQYQRRRARRQPAVGRRALDAEASGRIQSCPAPKP